jgi:hypothetical protein
MSYKPSFPQLATDSDETALETINNKVVAHNDDQRLQLYLPKLSGTVVTRFDLHRLLPQEVIDIPVHIPNKHIEALIESCTTTGKSITQPEQSDLYSTNTAPSWAILNRWKGINLTDVEGRRYWLAEDINFNERWGVNYMKQLRFDPDDTLFYIRAPLANPA